MNKYSLKIILGLKGPIITSGGGDIQHGFHTIFFRNSRGEPIIQASHIKGKLREALRALTNLNVLKTTNLNSLFGVENSEGEYRPTHGLLNITDFILFHDKGTSIQRAVLLKREGITNVSIDPLSGTSKENFLRVIEKLFNSGKEVRWQGYIDFFASNDEAATNIKSALMLGFKWITGIGASKGSGFGRLESVEIKWNDKKQKQFTSPNLEEPLNKFHLIIELEDDLLVGGVRKTVNFVSSEKTISGALLKGSFAACLNRHCGVYPLYTLIDDNNKKVFDKYPKLAENFSKIRFTHAFPSPPDSNTRAVVIPLSTVKTSKGIFDVAQQKNAVLDENGFSPAFQIDWKPHDRNISNKQTIDSLFGWAELQYANKTRTAIEPTLRSAAEDKLYTFQYITPYQPNDSRKNIWYANIQLPSDASKELIEQFYQAVDEGWLYLGKRNSRAEISLGKGWKNLKIASKPEMMGNRSIISLQTDAVMINPENLSKNNSVDLYQKYKKYWDDISGHSLTLSHFYASQKLIGGYLFLRYQYGKPYYPYFLTAAGSVFVLELVEEKYKDSAITKIKEWKNNGLPVPKWVYNKYKKQEDKLWEVFPFVPQNGFGEINVNLEWHWANKLFVFTEFLDD